MRTRTSTRTLQNNVLKPCLHSTNQGPVHTNADSKVYGFVLPKTHQLIRVHTTVFKAFPTVHTNTPRIRSEVDFPSMYGRSSSLSFSKDGRDILKFSFHSSGTTVCETKIVPPRACVSRPNPKSSRPCYPCVRAKSLI